MVVLAGDFPGSLCCSAAGWGGLGRPGFCLDRLDMHHPAGQETTGLREAGEENDARVSTRLFHDRRGTRSRQHRGTVLEIEA